MELKSQQGLEHGTEKIAISHPIGNPPFANYERNPFKKPVGKGCQRGVVFKGVVKQP